MLDIQLIRKESDRVVQQLKLRGVDFDLEKFSRLESERKLLQVQTQEYQARRNKLSKEIGILKSKGHSDNALEIEASEVSEKIKEGDTLLCNLQEHYQAFLAELPNFPDESVPFGEGEKDNQEIKQVGVIPEFDFPVLDHVALGEKLAGMDFGVSAKISGARYAWLSGSVAMLHRALIQFMLDRHTRENGYREVYVPYVVNEESLYGTGQLPKFSEDLFSISNRDHSHMYLIPTAEVPLTNYVRDQVLPLDELPIKLVSHTPCFRSEAGAYGKDTRGMIRQHQFDKVELVQVVSPDQSLDVLEALTRDAESILEALRLPYRRVLLCTRDMGFSACKTYDLEVWLPSQNSYREISSCSLFGDFQARRMRARFKDKNGKNQLVHTLNGSGLAIGRALVAILENNQNQDGSVTIPKVLHSYMNGLDKIAAN